MAITDEQKADTLNKHYHQVFTKDDDTDTPTLEPRDVEDTLTTIVIQKDEVLKKLKSLKISSAVRYTTKRLEGWKHHPNLQEGWPYESS